MVPIRVKFDVRYQKVKLEEDPDTYIFEDVEDDYLGSDDPGIDLGIEDGDIEIEDGDIEIEDGDFEPDNFDDVSLIDEES